ncbi:hypothetical protein [Shewanella sediminis]|uniref:hypothetical protein n=1 Tax=Shewanella sediminis TaxID=271097 RepID=UPI0002F56888|nr:hypothetical protein [Shewanella sediminis]
MSIFQGMFSELMAHGLGDVTGSGMARIALMLMPYMDVSHEVTEMLQGDAVWVDYQVGAGSAI